MKGCSAGGRWPVRSTAERRHGPVVQLGVHAALSRRRSRVQIPSGPPPRSSLPGAGRTWLPGRVAQLVERAPEKREVRGSMPRPTTGSAVTRSSVTLTSPGTSQHQSVRSRRRHVAWSALSRKALVGRAHTELESVLFRKAAAPSARLLRWIVKRRRMARGRACASRLAARP